MCVCVCVCVGGGLKEGDSLYARELKCCGVRGVLLHNYLLLA